ncbi:signal recognition particle protein [Clostridiales bacterium KA00134]|nr:signal recognition particle protein [Clostridiales bacterium KA00134]
MKLKPFLRKRGEIMAFENLSEKLQNALDSLRGKGKLTEKDIDSAMREVRLALLEADVNFKVVKDFVKNIKTQALGEKVMSSLTPGQQVIKIVNEELTELMGSTESKLDFSKKPSVILMSGLQGAGKTTTCGKLAKKLKKDGKRPLLVACDVYRPAAIKQLKIVGESVDVPVFSMGDKISPVDISKAAIEHASKNNNDVVIIDTAGRLHIDESLMAELKDINNAVNPSEILLVLDAMTGQDAVNVAKTFDDTLALTGVILTKLDGDARGGAALSLRAVTNKPIKFITTGEKMDALEVFHPARMASRILGMGDVLTLIEKAQANFDQESAKQLEQKLRNQTFTFDDFLTQMQQMRKMGPLEDLIGMLPGVNTKMLKGAKLDEKEFARVEAIIKSMTPKERTKPELIDMSRRKRIALGSGTSPADVNRLLKQFRDLRKMMKQFGNMGKNMRKGKFKLPFSF